MTESRKDGRSGNEPATRTAAVDRSEMLDRLARSTFGYFDRGINPSNGMVPDSTKQNSAATIAGSGHALACYVVAVERGYATRAHAIGRTLSCLRFLAQSEQSDGRNATGYRGFYYHFLDMETGRRAPRSELSTIDSAILFVGILVATQYYQRDTPEEREIRSLGDALYRRAEWDWAMNRDGAVSMGWTPERGFLRHGWTGYNEALFLYALACGSPTHPIPARGYDAWTATYRWKKIYGHEYLFGGPLFIHQLSHAYLDLRGIRDAYMREKGIDYFENSRRATLVQREYAIRNPRGFAGYDGNTWGITASDGPGPAARAIDGVDRCFWAYRARGVPFGPDDGTLSPWAAVASLPFAPEIVLNALVHLDRTHPQMTGELGYKCSYNETFKTSGAASSGWMSQGYYAIDQGPVVLMIENYRSELVWRLTRTCPYIERGLRAAGFDGGWLEAASTPPESDQPRANPHAS